MVMALEFCASLAVHMIAANPLSHASLLPSGSKIVNALCEEALNSQKYCSGRLLVLEVWSARSVLSDGWRWWFIVLFSTFRGRKMGNDVASLPLRCGCPGWGVTRKEVAWYLL